VFCSSELVVIVLLGDSHEIAVEYDASSATLKRDSQEVWALPGSPSIAVANARSDTEWAIVLPFSCASLHCG
jgi:hypothetical protein